MEKKYLLFDLDGTLTEPKEGITKSVQYALKAYGIEEDNLDKLTPFIGPPLKDSFIKFYGFEEEKAAEAVTKFREYFSVKGIFENLEFEGMSEVLKKLKEQGKKLYVATSKPEVYARQILDRFQMSQYFEFIGGADFEETRVKKADVVKYVLESARIEDKKAAVMIGDREHDIIGGKENGLYTIGVLYGYGDRKELLDAGADDIAESVEDLYEKCTKLS